MYPLIKQGYRCRFVPFEPEEARIGDIVLYISDEGQLVGHRLIGIQREKNEVFYRCKGDANLTEDRPVASSQVIGRMIYIEKGMKRILTDTAVLNIWSRIIIAYPIISRALQRYARRR